MVICPRCGREVDRLFEGLCRDCFKELHKFYRIKDFQITMCMDCGAVLIGGRWVKPSARENIIDILKRVFQYNLKVLNGELVDLRVSIDDPDVIFRAKLVGSAHPEIPKYEESVEYRARIIRDICPNCRLVRSGAERGFIQIRGYPHPLDRNASRLITNMINQLITKLESKNVGVITNISEVEGGIDITTTSVKIAKQIASYLRQHLPAQYLESYKLVGEKRGRKIYHVAISLRVLTLRVGDVVKYGNRLLGVTSISNKWVRFVDLDSGHVQYVAPQDVVDRVRYLGSATQIELKKIGDRYVGEFMGRVVEVEVPIKVYGFNYRGSPYIFKVP